MLHLAIRSFGGKMNTLKSTLSKIRKVHFAKPTKKGLFAIVVVLLLVGTLATFGYMNYTDRQTDKLLAQGGCSNQLIQDVLPYMQDGYARQMQPHIETILALPEFDRDPNCLYIVTLYEANLGNVEQAKRYLAQLEEVYNERRGFSPYFGHNTVSIEKLREKIALAEGFKKTFEQSTGVFNSSSQRR